jgi:hypothetical protein
MTVNKQHKELHAIDMQAGWKKSPGYPVNLQVWEKILAGSLDAANKRGSQTRLLRFAPGVYKTKPSVRDYWEEVYLVSGDLTVGNNDGGTAFAPHTYACRPPGVYPGPFKSEGGCVLLQIHYYDTPSHDTPSQNTPSYDTPGSKWLSAKSCVTPPSESWRRAA